MSTMAQTPAPKTPATALYTVLRPICMHGQRVEVGESVEMTPLQYAEARNAGKVGPYVAPPKPIKAPKKQEPAAAAAAPEATTPAPEETPNVAI